MLLIIIKSEYSLLAVVSAVKFLNVVRSVTYVGWISFSPCPISLLNLDVVYNTPFLSKISGTMAVLGSNSIFPLNLL